MILHSLILILALQSQAQSAPLKPEQILKDLQAKKETHTIAQAIATLPESLRKNHVLMFKSQSLQEASFQNPRVLLFNEDASMIVSFNGDVSQRGHESIETMRFIQDEARFVLEEIVFAKDLEARKKYLREQQDDIQLEIIDKRERRSGPNASMCLACHRQDPRPNWEAYPMWPGAYGQASDALGSTTQYNMNGSKVLPFDGEKELEQFPIFERSAPSKPRYASLIDLNQHWGKKRDATGLNTTFNIFLVSLNNQRIVRMWTQHPEYANFKDKLLQAMFPPKGGAYVPGYRDSVAFVALLQTVLPKTLWPQFLSMSFSPRAEMISFMSPGFFPEEIYLAWKVLDPSIERP